MAKLKLDVEALVVDSFEAGAGHRLSAGTVHGHNHTRGNHYTCGGAFSCGGQNTCDCPVTVDETCLEPCGTTLCETVPPVCIEA